MTYQMIDLFAGVGGFRMGMEQKNKFQTVFSCEIDRFAAQTYQANFGEVPFQDIRELDAKDLPDFDVLVGGFPCQAFSLSGKREGFSDEKGRGNLFFEIARIAKEKKPKVLLLENVRGLVVHDKGRTFKIIQEMLEEIGYHVYSEILDAQNFSLPQKRRRIFIVAIHKDIHHAPFTFPAGTGTDATFGSIREKEVDPKYLLSERAWNALKRHRERHEGKGNGFGYEVISDEDKANTIMVGGMGKEKNLIKEDYIHSNTVDSKGKVVNSEGLRYMTPREWARLQGFPDSFIIPVSMTQAYKQFGNSVPIAVVSEISESIASYLDKARERGMFVSST